jgi:hypothetical protein
MLNINIVATSKSHSRTKSSEKIRFSSRSPRKNAAPLFTAPCHFTPTDHYVTNETGHPFLSIEDPLWRHVCMEVQKLMPPLFVLNLSECQLGPLLSHNKQVDLYCPQGTVNSIKQYDFIILACLQKFFPALRQIRARNEFTF